MQRRTLARIALTLPVVATAGCVTRFVHSDGGYSEALRGVLISADKKTLVVVADKFHYIFQAPPQILTALDSRLQPAIGGVGFHSFHVDAENKVTGTVTLLVRREASLEQVELAKQAGFKLTSGMWWANVPIRGERYTARDKSQLPLQKLNQEYTVEITEAPGTLARVGRAAVTPVAVAADGVLIIGAVVLSPIWLPLLLGKICFVCGNSS